MVEYINEARHVFGSKHYIWAYTNGSLVTEERLKILNEVGINELRFDISANHYDLKSVELAIKHINKVSVEIPAIPEDREIVKAKLEIMESMGVKHLNLHQLMQTEFNQKAFQKRNYTMVHQQHYENHFPIMESELAALDIISFAADRISEMGINYCSKCYKTRFQGYGLAKRLASLFKGEMETVNSLGNLRRFSIKGSLEELNHLKSVLKLERDIETSLINNTDQPFLLFPQSCIEKVASFD